MNQNLKHKIRESLTSVLPITGVVLLLCFYVAPIAPSALLSFILGAAMLIVGMGLFTLGADMAMTPMGERVGAFMTKTKSLLVVVAGALILGIVITISEPDLQVLANQVPSIPNLTLIISVAVGVGIFLVIAFLRILFRIPLRYMLIGFYIGVFTLAFFVPRDFIAVAFDSGGVTTGPMTVPFIMAMGVGVASIRSDSSAGGDSFGLVALCSIGPILTVLILGLVYSPEGGAYVPVVVEDIADTGHMWAQFQNALPHYAGEVGMALGPIIVIFALFQVFGLKLPRRSIIRIGVGVVYTFLGLVLFLTGVNVGFMPTGNLLGQRIAGLSYNWIIIPIGMVIGYFIVAAEPAVHVLNRQVVDMTEGAVPGKALSRSLAIGVAVSVGLAMLRIMTGLEIMWILVPGYALALILSFFVPDIFTAIAFDSGGVASGPMTVTFLLPFAMGACDALGGNIITDAFGIVAMVAMTPLIAIQLLGLYFKLKTRKAADTAESEDELIDV